MIYRKAARRCDLFGFVKHFVRTLGLRISVLNVISDLLDLKTLSFVSLEKTSLRTPSVDTPVW